MMSHPFFLHPQLHNSHWFLGMLYYPVCSPPTAEEAAPEPEAAAEEAAPAPAEEEAPAPEEPAAEAPGVLFYFILGLILPPMQSGLYHFHCGISATRACTRLK